MASPKITDQQSGLPGIIARLVPPTVAAVTLVGEPASPLFPEEEERLPDRVLPSRRRDYTLGRTAARLALVQIGVNAGPILIGPRREPLWPDGVVGSISHAAGFATAIVARQTDHAGLGIDIEHGGRYFPELVEHVAFGPERKAIARSGDVPKATLELFSAKESVYKAFSPRVGRYFGFSAARIEWRGDLLTARLMKRLDAAYPNDREIGVGVGWHDGLVVTVVALDPD